MFFRIILKIVKLKKTHVYFNKLNGFAVWFVIAFSTAFKDFYSLSSLSNVAKRKQFSQKFHIKSVFLFLLLSIFWLAKIEWFSIYCNFRKDVLAPVYMGIVDNNESFWIGFFLLCLLPILVAFFLQKMFWHYKNEL